MALRLTIALLMLGMAAAAQGRAPLIRNPVMINIGFVCRWQSNCMKRQERAMRQALAYVKKYRPPARRVQICNRNASRARGRVDWIGFNNCVRNPAVRPAAVAARRRR